MRKIIFVKYNMERNPEYRIKTTAFVENGERYVEKTAIQPEAVPHIRQIYKNYDLILGMNKRIRYLKPEYQNEKVRYPFVDGLLTDIIFSGILTDLNAIVAKLTEIDLVLYDYKTEFYCDAEITDGFRNVFGEVSVPKGRWISRANIDLVIDNISFAGGEIIGYDYEWVFDFPIPVDYIRFRNLQLFYFKYGMYIGNQIAFKDYMEHFGLSAEQVETCREMEANFLKYVVGNSNSYMYRYCKTRISIKQIIQEREQFKNEAEEKGCTLDIIEDAFSRMNLLIKAREKEKNSQ